LVDEEEEVGEVARWCRGSAKWLRVTVVRCCGATVGGFYTMALGCCGAPRGME
jgi:hypothetical protein